MSFAATLPPSDGPQPNGRRLADIARGQQSDQLVHVAAFHGWKDAAEKVEC